MRNVTDEVATATHAWFARIGARRSVWKSAAWASYADTFENMHGGVRMSNTRMILAHLVQASCDVQVDTAVHQQTASNYRAGTTHVQVLGRNLTMSHAFPKTDSTPMPQIKAPRRQALGRKPNASRLQATTLCNVARAIRTNARKVFLLPCPTSFTFSSSSFLR